MQIEFNIKLLNDRQIQNMCSFFYGMANGSSSLNNPFPPFLEALKVESQKRDISWIYDDPKFIEAFEKMRKGSFEEIGAEMLHLVERK
ncbi:MAG: hypothetical protein AAF242_05300, partial [Bacteroidota bacterium]